MPQTPPCFPASKELSIAGKHPIGIAFGYKHDLVHLYIDVSPRLTNPPRFMIHPYELPSP